MRGLPAAVVKLGRHGPFGHQDILREVGKCWARTQFQIMKFIGLSAKDSPPTWSHLICALLEMLITVMIRLGVLQSSSRDGN